MSLTMSAGRAPALALLALLATLHVGSPSAAIADAVTAYEMDKVTPLDFNGDVRHLPLTQQTFADVPLNHPFASWIYQLAVEGITGGCATNPAQYCPDASVTRGQMAVFLVRTFNLPM